MKSYLPGSWYAVLGERVTVLLPAAEKRRVAGVWEKVEEGAGLDEVLDELLRGGLSSLSGFVLVAEQDGATRALFRGNARATFTTPQGPVRIDGTGASSWHEVTAHHVYGMLVQLDSEVLGGADLPIDTGLVRVARLSSPAVPAPTAVPSAPPVPATAPAVHPTAPAPVPAPVADTYGAPSATEPGLAQSILDQPTLVEQVPAPVAPPVNDLTVPAGSVPTAVVPVAAPDTDLTSDLIGFDTDSDHDGRTTMNERQAFARPADGIPGQPQAPAVTAQAVAVLLLSTGESIPVDRAVLFGRAPEARRFQVGEEPRLVTVPSPHQEISSTHLEIRPGSGVDHGTAVVTDLGSTNGTVIVQPGLGPEELRAGMAVQLIPGAVIDLGDGITIQVVNP